MPGLRGVGNAVMEFKHEAHNILGAGVVIDAERQIQGPLHPMHALDWHCVTLLCDGVQISVTRDAGVFWRWVFAGNDSFEVPHKVGVSRFHDRLMNYLCPGFPMSDNFRVYEYARIARDAYL